MYILLWDDAHLSDVPSYSRYPPLEPNVIYIHLALFLFCGICMSFNMKKRLAALIHALQIIFFAITLYINRKLRYSHWLKVTCLASSCIRLGRYLASLHQCWGNFLVNESKSAPFPFDSIPEFSFFKLLVFNSNSSRNYSIPTPIHLDLHMCTHQSIHHLAVYTVVCTVFCVTVLLNRTTVLAW